MFKYNINVNATTDPHTHHLSVQHQLLTQTIMSSLENTAFYIQHSSSVYMPVGNSNIHTQDLSLPSLFEFNWCCVDSIFPIYSLTHNRMHNIKTP
jgi:hypothetical protein